MERQTFSQFADEGTLVAHLVGRERSRSMPIITISPDEVVARLPAPCAIADLTTITNQDTPLTPTPDR